jgi:hypothetical protein
MKNVFMCMCDHYVLYLIRTGCMVYLKILVSTNGNDESNQLCFGLQSVGGVLNKHIWFNLTICKQKHNLLYCIFYLPTD